MKYTMKYITRNLAALAVLTFGFAGCQEETPDYMNIQFTRTGEVTLEAGMENASLSTKVSLDGMGEARWLRDDRIAVICDDKSSVELALDGTGDTRRAFFKGEIPEGRTMGDYAWYPSTMIPDENGLVNYELPDEIDINDNSGVCALMVAKISNSHKIEFKQAMAYLDITVTKLSADISSIEFEADRCIAGTFPVDLSKVIEEGLNAENLSKKIKITGLAAGATSLSLVLPVPPGEYGSFTMVTTNTTGDVSRTELLEANMTLSRGEYRNVSCDLASFELALKNTIEVAGVKWAPGNLQHYVGSNTIGFQQDWIIAPEQWSHRDHTNATAAIQFANADQYDYFNWGGIEDWVSNANTAYAKIDQATRPEFDLGGKMYTDQACTEETTDFESAKYGDVAFWASNGIYRMPTKTEMENLFNNTVAQYGYYTVGTRKIYGWLFRDPSEGETAGRNKTAKAFTDEDLSTALFLPITGRRAAVLGIQYKSQYTIIGRDNTGVYMTSTSKAITSDQNTAFDNPNNANYDSYNSRGKYYSYILYIKGNGLQWPDGSSYAYTAYSGFNIRPVLVESAE